MSIHPINLLSIKRYINVKLSIIFERFRDVLVYIFDYIFTFYFSNFLFTIYFSNDIKELLYLWMMSSLFYRCVAYLLFIILSLLKGFVICCPLRIFLSSTFCFIIFFDNFRRFDVILIKIHI